MDIAEIVGVEGKDVIQVRSELREKARPSYMAGIVIERELRTYREGL